MEIIKYPIQEKLILPDNFLSAFKDLSFAIFDIETTGLSPEYNQVILAGILYVKNENIVIEQFFCHHRREEKALLEAFYDRIQAFDVLISYNGDSFDIPFLNKRYRKHHIPAVIDPCKSFDILKFVRRKKEQLNLQDCKLKSVEKSLNIMRTDTISGKESVALYQLYETCKKDDIKKKILLHNYDDLYYFSKCLSILDQVDYGEFLAAAPFLLPVRQDQLCYVDKRSIKSTMLSCSGFYPTSNSDNDHLRYELGYKFSYFHRDQTFELHIPMSKGTLLNGDQCLYLNTNDFPISYEGHHKQINIPNNLIVLKIGKQEQTIEIVGFLSTLLKHLFSEV